MARPFWSGQLQISLVSFGINLVPATDAKSDIHFHQIDRRTGERVRHQNVSSENDGAVEKGDIVKGYEYSKGEYIQLEPSEIEQVRIESRHTIALEQFVNADEIDPAFYEKPYFVLPEKPAQAEGFAVVRKALEETKRVGLGKLAIGGREHLVAITTPKDPKLLGMMAYTLRFAEEVRDAAEAFDEMKSQKVDREQLTLAKELIDRKSSEFDPGMFKDNYEAAMRELIDAKLKHVSLPKERDSEPKGKVINLMDALRRSVGERTGKKARAVPADNPAKRLAGKAALKVVRSGLSSTAKHRKSA